MHIEFVFPFFSLSGFSSSHCTKNEVFHLAFNEEILNEKLHFFVQRHIFGVFSGTPTMLHFSVTY